MSALTIGSLFSGIGGLELGLERGIGNGASTIWQVEQSDYCRAVLAKHWPDAIRYDDVRTVGRSNLAPVDVLCGGFPCQDISTAGARAGLAGERSGLWRQYARLIRDLRPGYAVMENVAALLFRGIGDVLGDLAEIGYDAEWQCIPAAAVGAPHQRDRIFILAYPASESGYGLPHHAGGRRESARPRADVPVFGNCARHPRPVSGEWLPEPDVGRVAHGVPARVDRLRALGNAVVPAVAEVVGRLIAARETERAVA